MCGGGNNDDAKKALQWQKQQAADAAKKEAERQVRLKEGNSVINKLFDGEAVMGDRETTYDWTAFNDAAADARRSQTPTQTTRPAPQGPMTQPPNDRNGYANRPPITPPKKPSVPQAQTGGNGLKSFDDVTLPEGYKVVRGKGGYQIVGPDGKAYKSGDVLKYMGKYDTGARTGGFGDDFYNKYRTSSLDYYLPELDKQFTKAKSTLNFDHARAGTLQSSMASENVADLVYQNTMNEAMVRSKADNATAQLKNSVSAQKNGALTQLYATEDPSVAANTATNSVRTLQNSTPEFSPMGELFRNAVVGASGFAGGYNDYKNWGSPSGGGSGSGRTVS